VLQPSDHFCGRPLDPLQWVHVFSVLRAPELDTGLLVGSYQSGAEGQNPLPQSADHNFMTNFSVPNRDMILSNISAMSSIV